jgi:hypothetical protein
MFLLKKGEEYWDGEKWVSNWRIARVYGSVAHAISNAPDSGCIANGFTEEQWNEYYNQLEIQDKTI